MAIFTRVYSNSSAGQLTSGRGPIGLPLSRDELLDEFQRHANRKDEIPTALVSVSSRIVDTVWRAFRRHHQHGESPADIWVVFIRVPIPENEISVPGLHSARDLAMQCPHLGMSDAEVFRYEFVFEWAIPENYVLHQVSLQTLMDRGLEIPQTKSTIELRKSLAREFRECLDCPFELGMALGSLSEVFGLEAPLYWIAHHWYDDCVRTLVSWKFYYLEVKLVYPDGSDELVEPEIGQGKNEGIDWWLSEIEINEYLARELELYPRECVVNLESVVASEGFIAEAIEVGLLDPRLVGWPILKA